jgi:hypothetical protein
VAAHDAVSVASPRGLSAATSYMVPVIVGKTSLSIMAGAALEVVAIIALKTTKKC